MFDTVILGGCLTIRGRGTGSQTISSLGSVSWSGSSNRVSCVSHSFSGSIVLISSDEGDRFWVDISSWSFRNRWETCLGCRQDEISTQNRQEPLGNLSGMSSTILSDPHPDTDLVVVSLIHPWGE